VACAWQFSNVLLLHTVSIKDYRDGAPPPSPSSAQSTTIAGVTSSTIIIVGFVMFLVGWLVWRRRNAKRNEEAMIADMVAELEMPSTAEDVASPSLGPSSPYPEVDTPGQTPVVTPRKSQDQSDD